MKIIEPPALRFQCRHCSAKCEGEEQEFIPLNTTPPQWVVKCGFCNLENTVSPSPLVAKVVGCM